MAAQGTGSTPSKRKLVFLDASVLMAVSHSPMGGSALVMEVCCGRRFRAAFTARILLEARVNIVENFREPDLLRFYQQLAELDPEMVPPPSLDSLTRCVPLVGEKDAHVVAAALECGAGYLLTLDRRHLLASSILAAWLPLNVMTPEDFEEDSFRNLTDLRIQKYSSDKSQVIFLVHILQLVINLRPITVEQYALLFNYDSCQRDRLKDDSPAWISY